MIYGVNFNGTQIPSDVKRRFSTWIKLSGMGRGEKAYLVGVGQSELERDLMLIQADNGRRRLHVEARKTLAGVWYGIYTHYCESIPSVKPKRFPL